MKAFYLVITLLLGTGEPPVISVGPFQKGFCETVLLQVAGQKRVLLDGVVIERRVECKPASEVVDTTDA